MAHVRQSWPDFGLGFLVKVLKSFQVVSSPVGSGPRNGILRSSTWPVSRIRVWSVGLRGWGLQIGFRARVRVVGIRSGERAEGVGLRAEGLRLYGRVLGVGCGVWGVGCKVMV
jgi:hypothetical protein